VLGGGKIFLRPLFLTEISLHHACSCHKLEDGNAWAGKFFLLRMVESAGLAIGFYMETWGWCRTFPCRQPCGGCPRSATPELLTEDSLGFGGGGARRRRDCADTRTRYNEHLDHHYRRVHATSIDPGYSRIDSLRLNASAANGSAAGASRGWGEAGGERSLECETQGMALVSA
jgi:hypothetical protein